MTQSSELAQRLLRDYRAGLIPPPGAKATAWATLSATTAAPVASGSAALTATKVLSGVVLAVAVGTGALWLSSAGTSDTPRGARSDVETPEVAIATGARAAAERGPTEAFVAPPPAPAVSALRGEPEVGVAELAGESDPRDRGPLPSGPRGVAEVATTPAVAAPAPEPEVPPADGERPDSPSTLAEEVRILRAAEAALASGDPHGALVLLEEHVDRFPAGALARERDVRRVGALCRVGRVADARALAERTVAGHPSLADRLERACPAD